MRRPWGGMLPCQDAQTRGVMPYIVVYSDNCTINRPLLPSFPIMNASGMPVLGGGGRGVTIKKRQVQTRMKAYNDALSSNDGEVGKSEHAIYVGFC